MVVIAVRVPKTGRISLEPAGHSALGQFDIIPETGFDTAIHKHYYMKTKIEDITVLDGFCTTR